jgi:hypothetical protein
MWRYSALLLTLLVLTHPASPSAASAGDASPIGRLGWLAGCWQREAGASTTEEQWMRPRGRLMLGMSRTVRGDSTVEYEQLRIADERGTLVYHALPSGQSPTAFRAASVSDSVVTFENPAHDFPQRIIYRQAGSDSLHARIEGTRGGRTRGVDFRMRRVACAGG